MKHVVMIIANSPNPSYFRWFAELNHKEKAFKLSFIFLHTEMPALAEEVKKYDVESHWIYFNTYKSKPAQYLKVCYKLYKWFKRVKPDVVQTNLFDDSLPALQAAKMAGIKKRVITKQDTGFHVKHAQKAIKYDKRNNKNATHLIACSNESRDIILKYEDGDDKKITLIHHGVDEEFITTATTEQINFIKDKYNLHNKIVVGTVSRYIDLKRYVDMIEAARIVNTKNKNIVFIGLGMGHQKAELEELIKKYGLEQNFILTDMIDYSLIPACYACMDIYLHAAIIEAFGFVIAEAMFNRKPIITTRVGASRDVLEHLKSAYIVDFNSPEQIAEGITYYLTHDNKELIETAYQLARTNFSRVNMWSKYRDLFIS